MTEEEKDLLDKKLEKSIHNWQICALIISIITIIAMTCSVLFSENSKIKFLFTEKSNDFSLKNYSYIILLISCKPILLNNYHQKNSIYHPVKNIFLIFLPLLANIIFGVAFELNTDLPYFNLGYFFAYFILSDIPIIVMIFKIIKKNHLLTDEELEAKKQIDKDIKEKKQNIKEEQQKNKYYNELIKTCGFRFFIKYYNQIKTFEINDIEIDDNLPYEEKIKRIELIKNIINKGYSKFCIQRILETYSNNLTEKEFENANKILSIINLEKNDFLN